MAKRFVFNITDEHAELLEAHRKSFGLRSAAEALRHLIDTSPNARARIGAAASVRVPEVVEERWGRMALALTEDTGTGPPTKPVFKDGNPKIQLGPTPTPAGSRLKAEKGKK